MRPAKVVKAINWWHATGELFLIVVGILIALAISDWNDERVQRQQELSMLQEIRFALAADLASLEANLELFGEATSKITELSELLKSKPPYDPSMDRLFGAVYGIRVTNLNTAAYETLKSTGLQSVSNRELRIGIARIYDHWYQQITGGHDVDLGANIDLMRPYFLRHFRDLDIWNSATPIDYQVIINDPYFHNMVDYRLTVLRINQLNSYSGVIPEMRAVIDMLDLELSEQ
jgi:hypothetical protein